MKIGDRIRRINGFTDWAHKGFESVVEPCLRVGGSDLWYKDNKGVMSCIVESQWEVIPPEAEAKSERVIALLRLVKIATAAQLAIIHGDSKEFIDEQLRELKILVVTEL